MKSILVNSHSFGSDGIELLFDVEEDVTKSLDLWVTNHPEYYYVTKYSMADGSYRLNIEFYEEQQY